MIMKTARRVLAVLLTILLVASCTAAFALTRLDESKYAFTKVGEQTNVNENVTFQKYTLKSGVNETVVDAVALEFSTADGYIPMAFMGYAGTSATVEKHYQIATDKYGYEVVGAINGSFFSMDQGGNGQYGTLVDYIISNGKVMSAHAGDACEVVAFMSDGTFQVVSSMIDYALYINGQSVGSLYYINKTSGTKNAGNWGNGFYYFDTSCGRVTDTHSEVMGYNVLCKKLDHTDLVVGGTLKGEVISVTETTEGAQVSEGYDDVSDKFDIFVKSTSPNAKFVKDLKAGDSINISVTETVEASREIIESANSVIENVGWLVKDGVDQTQIKTSIGTHSVDLKARWTAFGRKADGSYVFFTTDSQTTDGSSYSTGNSPCATLQDVAKAMISLGCVDVIRMDGGGSVAMYAANDGSGNPGYLMVTDGYVRPVSDCILIVKKDTAADADVTKALKDKVEEVKKDEDLDASVQEVLDEIEAFLFKEPAPILSDARRLLMKLNAALSGKDELNAQIANAAGIKYNDYSFEVLEKIRAAYDVATEVFGDPEATAAAVAEATEDLRYWLAMTGKQDFSLSKGVSYTVDLNGAKNYTNFENVLVDDLIRLTDGAADGLEGTSTIYSAWQGAPTITLDLGSRKSVQAFVVHAARMLDWGISTPRGITVSVSDDGKNFREVATASAKDVTVEGKGTSEIGELVNSSAALSWNAFRVYLEPENAVQCRYVRFDFKLQGSFIWLTELEAVQVVEPINDAVYITGINRTVYTDDCCVFTHEAGNLKENDGAVNAKWTQNVFLKWSEEDGCYIVTKNTAGGGKAPDVTLAEDEVLVAVHGDVGGAGNPNKVYAAKNFPKGTKVGLYGVDVVNGKLSIAPFMRVYQEPEPDGIPGDLNNDGELDAVDYIKLKKAILGSLELTPDEESRADVNGDGEIDALDYIMLKKIVLKG